MRNDGQTILLLVLVFFAFCLVGYAFGETGLGALAGILVDLFILWRGATV